MSETNPSRKLKFGVLVQDSDYGNSPLLASLR